jgi:hypothetical protein
MSWYGGFVPPDEPDFSRKRRGRDLMTKITDVHIDRLLPRQGLRTSLRLSHRSRKQNQSGLRRLRSGRYPYQ